MEGILGIALLAALAGGFAFAYSRSVGREKKNKANLTVAEGQLDALEQEDEAIREFDRVGDLADDRRFVREPPGD